jgi:hypothetical protein
VIPSNVTPSKAIVWQRPTPKPHTDYLVGHCLSDAFRLPSITITRPKGRLPLDARRLISLQRFTTSRTMIR